VPEASWQAIDELNRSETKMFLNSREDLKGDQGAKKKAGSTSSEDAVKWVLRALKKQDRLVREIDLSRRTTALSDNALTAKERTLIRTPGAGCRRESGKLCRHVTNQCRVKGEIRARQEGIATRGGPEDQGKRSAAALQK